MTKTTRVAPEEVKSCCAALYGSEWASMLLGDSLHPGGLALTERLGVVLALGPGDRVLDVAAGKGATSVFLAERFGCEVTGIDYGLDAVAAAMVLAVSVGMAERVQFLQGDAEHLPFTDASFDCVICECSFCTFPDKRTAAAEFARVVRPGGRIGLGDLTRCGPLPDELQTLLAWIACLGDARPVNDYVECLRAAGFTNHIVEPHDDALAELVRSIRSRLLGAELLANLGKVALPAADIRGAGRLARAAATAVAEGRLGYSLLVATRV